MKFVILIHSNPQPWANPTSANTAEYQALPQEEQDELGARWDKVFGDAKGEVVYGCALTSTALPSPARLSSPVTGPGGGGPWVRTSGSGRTCAATLPAGLRPGVPTFTEVAWNGPYYRRLGYRTLPLDELGRDLAEARAREARLGRPVAVAGSRRSEQLLRQVGPGRPGAATAADLADLWTFALGAGRRRFSFGGA